jgi:hypothetical protein
LFVACGKGTDGPVGRGWLDVPCGKDGEVTLVRGTQDDGTDVGLCDSGDGGVPFAVNEVWLAIEGEIVCTTFGTLGPGTEN